MQAEDPVNLPEPASDNGKEKTRNAKQRMERREQAALDALRTLLRDHYAARFGRHEPTVDELSLNLRLTARPREGWELSLAKPFGKQVVDALAEAQALPGAFAEGRVFCYRCQTSDCSHSQPDDHWLVFRNYDATGRPVWCDFAQAVIEARDERIEQLYATPPAVLTLFQTGSELRKEQLDAFGRTSRSYSILAQVVAGYLPESSGYQRQTPAGDRLALTIQAVEARDLRQQLALRLNMIIGGETPDAWRERLGSRWCPWVGRALGAASRALARLQNDLAGARESGKSPAATYRQVPGIMRRLGQAIEQGARRDDRRTQHASQRQTERRPVHKALADTADAQVDDCFFDIRRETWIVRGKQGRAHVFGQDGRLVTSFALAAGNADFRVRTGRWRPVTAEEFAACQATVAAAGTRSHRRRKQAEK